MEHSLLSEMKMRAAQDENSHENLDSLGVGGRSVILNPFTNKNQSKRKKNLIVSTQFPLTEQI